MNRIAELRKERHLNQVGLAMKLNVSQYMISSYETGRHQPPADILIAMADFFNVSTDYLLGRSDVRYSADRFNALNENEITMLEMFKCLSKKKQEQAIGIVFALQNL